MIWFKRKLGQEPEAERRKDRQTGAGGSSSDELQNALDQAKTWGDRAAMAWQQGNRDLTQESLTRMWKYQVAAAELEGNEPPDGPPEPDDFFKGRDPGSSPPCPSGSNQPRRPLGPSSVPRNSLPLSGGDEVELPGAGGSSSDELQKALNQAKTWGNRAAMAWQQGNRDLTQEALTRIWKYQVAAAELEGTEPPDGPPEPDDFFKGWEPGSPPRGPSGSNQPRRPLGPSSVPRNSRPLSGGDEVALPGAGGCSSDEPQRALDQAKTWGNRATMAWQQGNRDLTQQALTRMWKYQVAAAELEGTEPPDGPPDPDDFFKG